MEGCGASDGDWEFEPHRGEEEEASNLTKRRTPSSEAVMRMRPAMFEYNGRGGASSRWVAESRSYSLLNYMADECSKR